MGGPVVFFVQRLISHWHGHTKSIPPEEDCPMRMRAHNGFAGWYFKHQNGDDMVAFIPGIAQSGAFLQLLAPEGARQFQISHLTVQKGIIQADDCRFSRRGCHIALPGVSGDIAYGPFTPLCSDIMGPFRFFPMECRHGILSMAHTLQGGLTIDGQPHHFHGGLGYAERDSGTSFPRSYLWMQCNDFTRPCSIMLSIAHIPFGASSFRGCICAIVYQGREYRLATYKGVKIQAFTSQHIVLSQGRLLLEVDILPSHTGHPLCAPQGGKMSTTIRESCNAQVRARLWEGGPMVFDLGSAHATYEFVPRLGG